MAPIAASTRYTVYSPVVPTTDFPAGFPVFDNADLLLLHNNVPIAFTVTASYVDGVSADAVLKAASPGVTGTVIVVGQRDTRRTDQYANGAPLPIRDHNYSLNRLTAEVQETRRDLTRAVKAKVGSTGPALPDPDNGKFLSWSGSSLVNAVMVAGSESLPGVASTYPRRNAANTAFEARTFAQVWADIAQFNRTGALVNIPVDRLLKDHVNVLEFAASEADRDALKAGTYAGDAGVIIQAALDYAEANGIRQVYLPKGTYPLTGSVRNGAYTRTLLVIHSNLDFIGDGYDSVIKFANNLTNSADTTLTAAGVPTSDYRCFSVDAADAAAFNAISLSNVTFKNFRVEGNAANNLVVSSSGGNIRRGYVINIPGGVNIDIENMWFENIPGRNVVNLGNNTSPPSHAGVKFIRNTVKNVGGAISGNEGQNDHSSIYCQGSRTFVALNSFENANLSFDPFAAPAHAVGALEIHGDNQIVLANSVYNYGTFGNTVAASHDSENNKWIGNIGKRILANAFTLWTYKPAGQDYPWLNKNVEFIANVIELGADAARLGGAGIFQNCDSQVTAATFKGFVAIGNHFVGAYKSNGGGAGAGIFVCSLDGATIALNTFQDLQGPAISVEQSDAMLPFKNTKIVDNTAIDCGIGGIRIQAIRINNPATTAYANGVALAVTNNPGLVRSNAGNYYVLVTAGGGNTANAPVHTSGEVTGADGYTWRWVGNAERVFSNIVIDGNMMDKSLVPAVAYANGVAYVASPTFPGVIHLSNVYELVKAGAGNTANAPVHTSGVVTGADGYAWRYLFTTALTARDCRGIGVVGGSPIMDLFIGDRNTYGNIVFSVRTSVTGALNVNVVNAPKVFAGPKAADPTYGTWLVGDRYDHTDPVAAGKMGRIVTTSGGGNSALWGTATAYSRGTWIRTSTGKVLECLGNVSGAASGTSHAVTEPNPANVSEQVVDGTVLWAYRAGTVAAWKQWGAIDA